MYIPSDAFINLFPFALVFIIINAYLLKYPLATCKQRIIFIVLIVFLGSLLWIIYPLWNAFFPVTTCTGYDCYMA